jgi:hypothetical protein
MDKITIEKSDELLLEAAPAGSKVILFGSHARGDAKPDSDLDFLVIEPRVADRRREMVRLHHIFTKPPRRGGSSMQSAKLAWLLLQKAKQDQYATCFPFTTTLARSTVYGPNTVSNASRNWLRLLSRRKIADA